MAAEKDGACSPNRKNNRLLEYYKIMTGNVPDLRMILVDKQLNVLVMSGFDDEDDPWTKTGKSTGKLNEILTDEIGEMLAPLLDMALKGIEISREFSIRGIQFALQIISVALDEEVDSCLILIRDITRKKLIEDQLRLSKKEVEQANEAKNLFIANMSHEIRTPLNAIMGFSKQLGKSRLTKKQQKFTDIIDKSSQHLLSIIDDIMVLSKFEVGELQLDKDLFRIREVIDSVNKVLQLRMTKKNIEYRVSTEKISEQVLFGDSGKLRQILINLLSNAIKYTKAGFVELRCSSREFGENGFLVKFDVIDSGIGIPEHKIDDIYEPFRQADLSSRRKFMGSGLGLTITKKLVELQDGRISVKSAVGKGTHFTVEIPYQVSEKELPEQEKFLMDEAYIKDELKKRKVLLVDDDAVNRMLGEIVLKDFGITPVLATDGYDALKKYRPGLFDLILLDIHMPGMDGLQVTDHIRRQEKDTGYNVKIIALTANVLKKKIRAFLRGGMDDYILKPFTEEKMFRTIIKNLYGNNISDVEYKKSSGGHSNYEDAGNFKLSEIIRVGKGNRQFVLNIVGTMIQNMTILTGKMEKDLENKDYRSLGEVSHKLIPSLEQFRKKDAATLLKRIEYLTLKEKKYKEVPLLVKLVLKELRDAIEELKASEDKIFEV